MPLAILYPLQPGRKHHQVEAKAATQGNVIENSSGNNCACTQQNHERPLLCQQNSKSSMLTD